MKRRVLYVLSLVIATLVVLLLHRGVTPYTRGSISSATRQGSTFISHTVPRSKVAYVTVSKYMGQQGAGARDIANLQCFLMSLQKSLGLSFVLMEPYYTDSHFHGIDRNSTAAIKLRDIFDFEHFNTISKETGRTEMVEYNEFVQKCPSYIILINFDEKPEMNETVLWQSDTVNGIPECLERDKLHELDSSFTRHNSQNICVVRAVALPIYKESTQENPVLIRDSIFQEWSPQNVTLMFSRWGGHIPLESGRCGRERRSNISKLLFRPSKRLQQDAKRYEELFLDNQHRLAIMMRVEHVIREYNYGERPAKQIDKLLQ